MIRENDVLLNQKENNSKTISNNCGLYYSGNNRFYALFQQ